MLRPREWLVVVDKLWDPRNLSHRFRQWFQFAPHLEVETDDIGWSVTKPDDWHLWGIPLSEGKRSKVMQGVTEPELQGWISYRDNEFEPTPSVFLTHSGSSVTLATLFCFSEVLPIPGRSTWSEDFLALRWASRFEWEVTVNTDASADLDLNVVIHKR